MANDAFTELACHLNAISLRNTNKGILSRISPQIGGRSLSTNGVGFSCAKWASDQRVRRGAEMVINQMVGEQV